MITFGKPIIDTDEMSAIKEVVHSGVYVHGSKTIEFEKAFCKHLGYNNAISVANCTAGLHLAHHSITKSIDSSLKKKNEVLCPAMTHVATAHAIELAGLKPIFVDCNDDDGNMDVEIMRSYINNKTVGVAAMHFNGMPCDIKSIVEIANAHSLYVVEDCAISLGAKVDGKPVGTFGNAGAFSFHPVKQITTGEGGMLVMNDFEFSKELALERAFGVDRAFNKRKIPGLYDVKTLGFNYRMAEIPAAMGIEQLKKLSRFQNQRKNNFIALKKAFKKIPGVKIKGADINDDRSYYCLILQIKNCTSNVRNDLIAKLKIAGVQTSIYYPHPLPRLNFYKKTYGYDPKKYPNAINFADKCIAFPVAPHLNEDDMIRIAEIFNKVIK